VPLLEQVLEKYPQQVKLVYKNFPLRSHSYSAPAALAALAAHRQDRFWEFHDRLFENYRQLNDRKIRGIAAQMGLDLQTFEKDRRDPGLIALVNRDIREGHKAGVRGTPSVFINGKKLKSRSMQGFEASIRRALALARK
jgi:protein-disulfide isomerase